MNLAGRNIKLIFSLYEIAYKIKSAHIKRVHPDWSAEQIHNEAVRLIAAGNT